MSLGNGNPKEGDKGSNFNYELKVLQGLEAIAVALEAGIKNPQFIRTSDGVVVTGTTVATKSTSVLIPANTVSVGDSIFVRTRCRKTGTAGTSIQFISVNTLDAVGGNGISIASLGNTGAYAQSSRTLVVKSSTSTEVFPYNTGGFDDDASSTTAVSTYNINWAQDQYFVFSMQNLNSADSTVTSYYEITVNKG